METSLMFSQYRMCSCTEDSHGEDNATMKSTGWAREGGDLEEGRYRGLSRDAGGQVTLWN